MSTFRLSFFKSGIVGSSTFLLDNLIFALLNAYRFNILTCFVLSFIISTFYNFILNLRWTFRSKKGICDAVLRYFIYTLSSLILNSILIYLVFKFMENALLSKLLVTIMLYPFMFVSARKYVF